MDDTCNIGHRLDDINYYKILNISEKAGVNDIKKAYRVLARKYHPDKNPEVSDEIMKQINIAFEILSDSEKRKQYDKSIIKNFINTIEVEGEGSDKTHVHIRTEWEVTKTTDIDKEYSFTFQTSDHNYNVEDDDWINYDRVTDKKDNDSSLLSRYHIIVEPSLCLAFGSCETLAPKVFVVEKNKQINPKAIVRSEIMEDFDKILDAAKTCPTKAIIIIDRHTGESIFP